VAVGEAKSLSVLTFVALVLVWTPHALAADAPPESDRAAVLKDLTACRPIADPTVLLR
jgi:hypothetical protein